MSRRVPGGQAGQPADNDSEREDTSVVPPAAGAPRPFGSTSHEEIAAALRRDHAAFLGEVRQGQPFIRVVFGLAGVLDELDILRLVGSLPELPAELGWLRLREQARGQRVALLAALGIDEEE